MFANKVTSQEVVNFPSLTLSDLETDSDSDSVSDFDSDFSDFIDEKLQENEISEKKKHIIIPPLALANRKIQGKFSRVKDSIISHLNLRAINAIMRINLMANPIKKTEADEVWYDLYCDANLDESRDTLSCPI